LINWASVLAAFALLAGFFNVIGVHLERIGAQRRNYCTASPAAGRRRHALRAAFDAVSVGGSTRPARSRWLFDNVIVQLEIAVAASSRSSWPTPPTALRGSAAPGTRRPVWAMLLFCSPYRRARAHG
jgi:hypothetical protein